MRVRQRRTNREISHAHKRMARRGDRSSRASERRDWRRGERFAGGRAPMVRREPREAALLRRQDLLGQHASVCDLQALVFQQQGLL